MTKPLDLAIEDVLAHSVRPALSSHAGSVRLLETNENEVALELVGSCRSCYFRRGCVANLVQPELLHIIGSRAIRY